MSKPPPYDLDAERSLLGGLVVDSDVAFGALNGFSPAAFHKPAHSHIFAAIRSLHASGSPVDHVTIADELRRAGFFDHVGGAPGLVEAVPWAPPEGAAAYAAVVERHAEARRLIAAAGGVASAATAGDVAGARRLLAEALEVTRASGEDYEDDPDVDAFLDSPDPDYEWVVEGLVERGDRVMVTGEEGRGKSTLLRQLGVQVAVGVHPFTLAPIDPLRVLFVDAENSERQARRAFRGLRSTAGDEYVPGNLRVRVLGHAVDLADRSVEDDLARRIERQQIDLLIIGPLYKLVTGDPIKEEPARAVADAIDRLRAVRGSAVVIEAHSPYSEGSRSKRPIRPYGASLWSRWPEFGLYLDPEGPLRNWRGQRDQRSWPARLAHGEPWPWVPQDGPTEPETWHGPTECADAIVALLIELGVELSTNKLAVELRARGRGYRDTTVADAAAIAHQRGDLTRRSGPRGAWLYNATQPPKADDVLDF